MFRGLQVVNSSGGSMQVAGEKMGRKLGQCCCCVLGVVRRRYPRLASEDWVDSVKGRARSACISASTRPAQRRRRIRPGSSRASAAICHMIPHHHAPGVRDLGPFCNACELCCGASFQRSHVSQHPEAAASGCVPRRALGNPLWLAGSHGGLSAPLQ